MEALTDKVHKQGEHIPQHCYISHKHMHPCISSSAFLLRGAAHALAVDASYPSTCTDKWRPAAICQEYIRSLELCRSYAQNQVRNAHPQRIFWLLVAVLNATQYLSRYSA